jgi:hypothetical protein
MEVVGGFAPFQASLKNVPLFTLYDDGRVIFEPSGAAGEGPALPPLRESVLSVDASQELVERALDRYGLREARRDYAVDGVADATTTVFTVDADGVVKTVSAYGLGFGNEGRDRGMLRRLERLPEHLADPTAWLPADAAVAEHSPMRYRGIFVEDDPEDPDLVPWPWTDLSPADLQPLEDAVAFSQADLTPDQVALVTDVPNGGATGIAIASPDGQAAWRLSFRPLLPDQPPLPATEDDEASPAPQPTIRPRVTGADIQDRYAYVDSA